MTDLREAWIAEAKRRTEIDRKGSVSWSWKDTFANHLTDLIEQDWRPEPEVDAVTLAAREWIKAKMPASAEIVDSGYADDRWPLVAAFRAGHAHALANCADVRRMDWLEAAPKLNLKRMAHEMEYGVTIAPLRTKIDRAMEGGE